MANSPDQPELSSALQTVREHPTDFAAWDALEAAAEEAQAPEPVAELYLEALALEHSPAAMRRLHERSVRFGEAWFGDDAPQMQALLIRVFELEPRDEVIFDRLVVSLTSAGSWALLLRVYELALTATDSLERRVTLLEEAARVARDAADDPARALALFSQLLALRPGDAQARAQLERLLERTGRAHEIVLTLSAPERAASLTVDEKVRVAGLWWRELKSAPHALALVSELLQRDPDSAPALQLAEEIFASEEVSPSARRAALTLLLELRERQGQALERAQLLRRGASLYEPPERERLQLEAAELLRAHGQSGEAFAELSRLFVEDPEDDSRLAALEQTAHASEQLEALGETLAQAAPRARSTERRLLLLRRAAALAATRPEGRERARVLYQQVIAQHEDHAAALEAARALEPLLREGFDPRERLDLLTRLAELERDPAARREVLTALAQAARERGEPERARLAYRQRLESDPRDEEALQGLIELHEERAEYPQLIAVLRERVAVSEGGGARDLARIAQLYIEQLHDVDAGLEALRQLHAVSPEQAIELGVGELLARAAEREVASSAHVASALGDAYRSWLGEPERALANYARALAANPASEPARQGLQRLLDEPAVRGRAADLLAGAYATVDDVDALLALLPHRVAAAAGAPERARLLRQAAQLEAARRNAPERAFSHACEALIEEPSDSAYDLDLWRLAEQLSQFDALASALGRAADRLDVALPRHAQLRISQGELFELRTLDLARALEAYRSAVKALPNDAALAEAVCRVAALLGRYEDAFEMVVALADRLDHVPDGLLSLLEERAAEDDSFAALCAAARAVLERARTHAAVRRELLLRVADWYERRAGDPAAAEAILVEASKLGGPHAETLRRLAALQRRAPGRALFDSLMAAAELNDRELVQLAEAAELARTALQDDALERRVLEQLVTRGATLVRQGVRELDGVSAEEVLVRAVHRLADKLALAEEPARELALLREASEYPLGKEHARAFAERAARLALGSLQDSELGLALYQRALELAPRDPMLLAALSAEYDRTGRLDDLVVLKRRELAATENVSRRLELRLELARVLGEIEARGGRLSAIRENLREAPGHTESIEVAERILKQQGELPAVYELLTGQAAQLEAVGEVARSASLWARAAELADLELHDEGRALSAYQRFAGLKHDDKVLEALSRIRLGRGEPALAVPWLERSLETRSPEQRSEVRIRLARAHEAAGQHDAALAALESGVAERPSDLALRELLASLYEKNERYEPLAALLAESAERAVEPEQVLDYARRAAQLFSERLGQPERSVDVLARAVSVNGADRAIKLEYVDALIAAGRLEDAQQVLEAMVQEYGRRRSPERAELHLRLSRVAKAAGNLDEALFQLDNAASMDRSHPTILRDLGELALEAKQFERAERAYRTLLIIVRKPPPGVQPSVGAAEVLYQLHRIALELGQRDKAAELLESAVQTAVHTEDETARLKSLLVGRGEPELLLRVLELRLSQVSSAATEAEVLSDLADVLESTLERKDEALEARLKALACAPELDALHAATLRVAQALGRERRYVETLLGLIERARRRDDLTLASELGLRAGSVAEHMLADFEVAATGYGQVAPGSTGYIEAQFALARVAEKLGRADEEIAVLEQITALPDEAYAEAKRGALYRLIELRVQRPELREQALEQLAQLVREQPDFARASQILQTAYESDPADLGTLGLLEQMARQSEDPRVLLDALERRVRLDDVPLETVRESAELALSLDDGPRAERLLTRAIELADARERSGEGAWATVLLARHLQGRGDVDGALSWLERAMLNTEPSESFELGLELAALATKQGDHERAARVYERLREKQPDDRRVWAPLLTFYKERGELDRMFEVVQSTLGSLEAQVDRSALRLETARLLFEAEREEQGAALLEDVLVEDPDHAEAALKLADLYERRGDYNRFVELLSRKLESARERGSPSIVPLSLRMGAMLAESQPEQAAEVYRRALSMVPDSPELLRAAIEQTDAREQASERAELITRYLTAGDAAEREQALPYALWLVDHRAEQLDPSAFEQALDLASRVAPDRREIAERLEQWYRERDNHERLAELLERRALRATDSAQAIELLTEAAELRLAELGQAGAAASLLRKARELAPHDLVLLRSAVHASAASGELAAALGEVDAALEHAQRSPGERVELLLLRAEVAALAAMHDEAVVSLTVAHKLDREAVFEPLVQGIERARAAARERGNQLRERELTLRLANLHHEHGDLDRSIDIVQGWLASASDDIEAQRVLLELTAIAKRYGSTLEIAEKLISQDELQVLAHVGERLLEASRGLGRPELARAALEHALGREPSEPGLLALLEQLYLELGDRLALARLLSARITPESAPEQRFEQLRRVGQLLVEAGEPDQAMAYLSRALEIRPDDLVSVLAVVDAHMSAGRAGEARALIERSMSSLRQRRSPELAQLRHRMSKLVHAEGDQEGRYTWLNSALEADMNNGEVASELAVVAQEQGQLETALKALRAITMMKGESSMSRAEAFYRQAIIVAQKGEPRRAVLWAKKAKAEDQHFPGVDRLISELEGA